MKELREEAKMKLKLAKELKKAQDAIAGRVAYAEAFGSGFEIPVRGPPPAVGPMELGELAENPWEWIRRYPNDPGNLDPNDVEVGVDRWWETDEL